MIVCFITFMLTFLSVIHLLLEIPKIVEKWKRIESHVFLVFRYFVEFEMPYPKSHKLEKLSINSVVGDALEVLEEMLMLMAERTHCDNNNMGNELFFSLSIELVHTGPDLKYFGVGHQIKISKLADSLYSTMKDVLVFVMAEMAKESSIDYKFQVPKHTSFVGSIIKVLILILYEYSLSPLTLLLTILHIVNIWMAFVIQVVNMDLMQIKRSF